MKDECNNGTVCGKTKVTEITNVLRKLMTTCLVWWLARLTAIQEVPGLIPGYTLEIFLEI